MEWFSYCLPPEQRKLREFCVLASHRFMVVCSGFCKDLFGGGRSPNHQEKQNRDAIIQVLLIKRVSGDTTHCLKDIISVQQYTRMEFMETYDVTAANSIPATLSSNLQKNGRLVLRHLYDFVGIVGFVRFMKGYYMVIVKESENLGVIGTHDVYTCKQTDMVKLYSETDHSKSGNDVKVGKHNVSFWKRMTSGQSPLDIAEERYKDLFQLVDLTSSKSFYWSYTYDITQCLQTNVAAVHRENGPVNSPSGNSVGLTSTGTGSNSRFIWNHFLTREFLDAVYTNSEKRVDNDETTDSRIWHCCWTIPLIHGSFSQQRCSVLSKALTLTLIARRSRFFAGTRYLKRGVNDQGNVANDVEVEQIVQDEGLLRGYDYPCISSYVQMRGSIPTYWTQETSVAVPKPPILQFRFDPSFTATRQHFENLVQRYGSPIICVNLVKLYERQKRETLVGQEYLNAVQFLNSLSFRLPSVKLKDESFRGEDLGEIDDQDVDKPKMHLSKPIIQYLALDFTRLSKEKSSSLLQALDEMAQRVLQSTSLFAVTRIRVHDQEPKPGTAHMKLRTETPVRIKANKSSNSSASFEAGLVSRCNWGDIQYNSEKECDGLPLTSPDDVDYTTLRWSALSETFEPFFLKNMSFIGNANQRQEVADTPTKEEILKERVISSASSSSAKPFGTPAWSRSYRDSMGEVDYRGDDLGGYKNKLRHRDSASSKSQSGISVGNISNSSCSLSDDDETLDYFKKNLDNSPILHPSSVSPLKSQRMDGNCLRIQSAGPEPKHNRRYAKYKVETQSGVGRTNCIDCLDRSNVAQFCIGLRALGEQLKLLSILNEPDLKPGSKIVLVLMKLYEELGDRISNQYGGSSAHRKSSKLLSDVSIILSRQKELLTSVKRYYSNSFTDYAKQDAINLFLGIFHPPNAYDPSRDDNYSHSIDSTEIKSINLGESDLANVDEVDMRGSVNNKLDIEDGKQKIRNLLRKHLWELESDFYMHNSNVCLIPKLAVSVEDGDDANKRFTISNQCAHEFEWWRQPLSKFEKKAALPREMFIKNADINSDAADIGIGAQTQESSYTFEFTSFDNLFAKAFFRPNELCDVDSAEKGVPGHNSGNLVNTDVSSVQSQSIGEVEKAGDPSMEKISLLTHTQKLSSFSSPLPTWTSRFGLSSSSLSNLGYGGVNKDVSDDRKEEDDFLPDLDHGDSSYTQYEKYVRYNNNPFSLFKDDNPDDVQYIKKHYDSYVDCLHDFMIPENDAWEMRRLSAYAGATSVLVSGPYKGLPRSFPAKVFYLDRIKKNQEISKNEY